MHYQSMKTREWILGKDTVDDLSECKNLGVLKNYIDSFSSNVDDNIEKTRNKARMILFSHLDRRKVNPLIYISVKFWRQTCLPSLLFGAELFKSLKMMQGCNSVTLIQTFILFRPVLKIYLLHVVECSERTVLFLS